ncbi:zinc finger protein 638-like [Sceloporus undulatus]|uniref:zinc finger protein 638-like n=1 Tax=Sceloporus undulatus TaxID=8520 RepID=UPI001C4B95AC|nr:zinc finger protein 638-like [Sceloporus undulatus]
MHKGNKPPQMGGPLPAQHQGNMPPWMRERFPDAMWGPEGNMSPWKSGPGYDGRCELGEPMPPWRRGPFPGERCGGSMPPEMRGPFLGQRCGGSMPPEMRGPFPGEMGERRGPVPPQMRGPFPEEMGERKGPVPPQMRGPFPEEMGERRGPVPPQMRGPFPEEMGERRGPVPPQMRGPFPEEMGERRGPVPPQMRGPFPGEMSERRGCVPQPMQDPFPGEMGEHRGNMAPRMRGPCSDAMFEQRGNVPPQIRGPFPGEMCEPNRIVPSQMNRPNSSDPWPRGPLPGEDDIRRPALSPAIKQKDVGNSAPVHLEKDSFQSGNHSYNQLASAKVGEPTTKVQERYIQEGAERILESFGLSHEDLEELSSYPENQLKPENMPEILRTIRMRKMAQQIPSRDTLGGDGLYSPLTGPMGTAQPSTPFMGPSVSQPTKLPTSSESWKMNKCPTPSMMNDYYGAFPRVFPHTCILCKIECIHSTGWLLHLNTATHSESCHQLRQQYPDWNPEDASFRKRYESDRNANQAPRQPSVSSSPERSRSSHSRFQSRSRSRSPGHGRASRQRSRSPISPRMSPTDSRTSRQSAAQYVAVEQPHTQSEHHGKLSKEEQPKVEAASQEQSKTDPQPSVLSSLVEKSVSQAMSLLQPGGTGSGSLIQGVGLPTLPPVQFDPTSVSLGLVSMMQMVATQVVQAVLAAKEGSSGQAVASAAPSSAVGSVTPQPSSSASCNVEKQGNKQEVVPRTVSPHAGVSKQGKPKQVLICGHNIIVQARQRAESSSHWLTAWPWFHGHDQMAWPV